MSFSKLGTQPIATKAPQDKPIQPQHQGQQQHQSGQQQYQQLQKPEEITLVVSYIKGISEKFKILCKSKGIQVHFKGINTLRIQLVNHKDKDPKLQKSGIIYHYMCPHLNCPEAYIGETGRALGDRVIEHLKAPSPI